MTLLDVLREMGLASALAAELHPEGPNEVQARWVFNVSRAALEARALLELEREIRAMDYARVRLAPLLEQLDRIRTDLRLPPREGGVPS